MLAVAIGRARWPLGWGLRVADARRVLAPVAEKRRGEVVVVVLEELAFSFAFLLEAS